MLPSVGGWAVHLGNAGLTEVQLKILREVALNYRRAVRARQHQNDAVDAAIEEYRLS
jgi:hypothetical protein